MADVLSRSFSFIFYIIIGYVLKRIGVLKKEDFRTLSRLLMTFTLPCAIIVNFSAMEQPDPTLLFLCVLGFLSNAVTMTIGYLRGRKQGTHEQAFQMLNLSGHSVGSVSLAYSQAFLSPLGVVATSLFDTGNSIMSTGINGTVAELTAHRGEDGYRISVRGIVVSLLSSVPFVTYILMTVVAFVRLPVPALIVRIASVGAGANTFVAMLMMGVGLELHLSAGKRREILRLTAIRTVWVMVMTLLFLNLRFLSYEIRLGLVMAGMAPVSALAPPFTDRIGGDVEMSSTITSIGIIISMVMLTVFSLLTV